jgi:phage terminase large subunit-like protein
MTNGVSSIDYASRATLYAHDVVTGKILSSKWVKLACTRHLDDLQKDFRWVYSPTKADAICKFAELMRHEKGILQGQRVKLEPAQIFILCSIFGWVDKETNIRKYREALVMLPRGNGKSPLAAIIALWMAFFDGEPGSEVYTGANKEKQAMEVFRPAKAMVEQSTELTERFGIKAAAKSIFQPSSRSRFIPVVKKPGDGASVYLGVLDELHEALDSTLYDTIKTGANKRPNSLLLTISTAGVSSTENPCYQLQQTVEKVLEGALENGFPARTYRSWYIPSEWYSALLLTKAYKGFSLPLPE